MPETVIWYKAADERPMRLNIILHHLFTRSTVNQMMNKSVTVMPYDPARAGAKD